MQHASIALQQRRGASSRASTQKSPFFVATEIYDAIHENVANKAGVAAVRADMREMELRLEKQIDRVVIRLGALGAVIATLLFAALQRWPPYG